MKLYKHSAGPPGHEYLIVTDSPRLGGVICGTIERETRTFDGGGPHECYVARVWDIYPMPCETSADAVAYLNSVLSGAHTHLGKVPINERYWRESEAK